MYRKMKKLGLPCILMLGLVFGGCSSKESQNSQPEDTTPVTKTCRAELMDMSATITMTAPGLNKVVSEMKMDISMPASYFDLENFDEVGSEIKTLIVDELASQLNISKNDVSAYIEGDNLDVMITMRENNMRTILGLEDDASMILQDMVAELEKEGEATCK